MRFLIDILVFFLRIYMWILFIRVILSWFRISPRGIWWRGYKFLIDITEPYLLFFRKIIKPIRVGRGYLDLSYIAGIMVIEILLILIRLLVLRYV